MHLPSPSTRPLIYPLTVLLLALPAACTGTGGAQESSASASAGSTGGASTGAATEGATSTSGGTTGGTASGSGDGGNTFIADMPPPMFECDVWEQDCPDGQKCMPWADDGGSSWNALKCEEVDPNPKQPGDTCTVEGNGVSGVDDCDIGAMCWNVDPQTNMGSCVAMCTGSQADPKCEAGTSCLIANGGVLILCLPACDPLLQDCKAGDTCLPNTAGDGFACILDASGDMAPAGTPCEFANACNVGLICAGADAVPGCQGAQGCCAPYCDLTDGEATTMCNNAFETPGAECVAFFPEGAAPPGHEDVGVCVLPQ